MSLFPAFLKLENRPVLVVGGGSIATAKIPGLLEARARVRIVAPRLSPQLLHWVRTEAVSWSSKLFSPEDLDGVFLVVAATSLPEVNAAVFEAADRRNILCNAVDDINHCHFYCGSVVQRGDLQIAISTNGKSPALAQRLRLELEQQFAPEYAAWIEWLGAAREALRSQPAEAETTRQRLHLIASRPMFEKFLEQTRRATGNHGAA